MPSFRTLSISAAVMSGLMVAPASASASAENAPPAPKPYNLTFVFPATGYAIGYETVRITVVNIAPAAKNGTLASCNGSILFNGPDGKQIPDSKTSTAITKLGTGKMQSGEYVPNPQIPIPGRSELQGVVQITVDPSAPAPCALLMTLEVYETASGVTRAIVTTATEEPVPQQSIIGRGL